MLSNLTFLSVVVLVIIENRNPDLKYPRAVKDEKRRIVLDWLLEFRFSSVLLLSKRIGSNPVNSNRFFNSLLADGVIQKFKNVHTKGDAYVMLTSAGVSYLEAMGRDVSRASVRVHNLGKYSHIVHDISVQSVVLDLLGGFTEVVWDRHIDLPDSVERPDALMKSKGGDWVALEFERWRKDTKRIYMVFNNAARSIVDKHYKGVFFYFSSDADRKYYEKLFLTEEWPRYKREGKSSKIVNLNNSFFPNQFSNLRQCFIFRYYPVV